MAAEDESVKKQRTKASREMFGNERGFSLLEMSVVGAIMIIILAMAVLQIQPSTQTAKADNALREMVEQVRQAREYSIEKRRYIQITFSTVNSVATIQTIQRNDLTVGGGATNPVLSTITVQSPVTFVVFAALGDTPDAYGNSNAILFGGTNGGPTGGMMFSSDGELVNGTIAVAGGPATPINGSVFLGISGTQATARALTVMGTTGRVHGWRAGGTAWTQF